jgi:transposase
LRKRSETIPGISILGATTIATIVTDPKMFQSGRDFAAWVRLVPRQDSTGGKQKLGPISKQGDRYLRRVGSASAINGGRLVELHRDWAVIELSANGSRHVFERRRVDAANVTLPWIEWGRRPGDV